MALAENCNLILGGIRARLPVILSTAICSERLTEVKLPKPGIAIVSMSEQRSPMTLTNAFTNADVFLTSALSLFDKRVIKVLLSISIISGNNHSLCRRFARNHAYSRSLVSVQWDATYCCFCFLLNLLFCLGCAVPMA